VRRPAPPPELDPPNAALAEGVMTPAKPPLILILMGVSGCGKTTIGRLLAETLSWPMLEGDAFHSAANVAKMRAKVPLSDADRGPWLAAIARRMAEWQDSGTSGVVTCSALKRSYRNSLIADCGGARFIYLKGARDVIRARLIDRPHHFMPVDLLDSQFAILEEPGPGELALTVTIDPSPAEVVAEILSKTTSL
jgi:carbohydrate kinase (thermoresistant glucokinase family)